MPLRIVIFFLFFDTVSIFLCNRSNAQDFNIESDTLLKIGTIVVNSEKILIKRDQLYLQDSLAVNKTGFRVASFTMAAITLGQTRELKSSSALLSTEMKNLIKGSKPTYKFIYLRNIILFDKFGIEIKSGIKEVRISFID